MNELLFPYQEEARDANLRALGSADACFDVMPTGTGKSRVGAATAREVANRGGRTLILVHRKEFIRQWGRACDVFGLNWAIEQGENRAEREAMFGRVDVVIGSKDTMQRTRLEKWNPRTFDLVIADESHHGIMKSWVNVMGHFHHAKRLGLTATPERTDEETIQTVFGNCAYELKFWDAVDRKYIAAPYFYRPSAPVDLSALKASGDDLNKGDLEDAISPHISELVSLSLPHIDHRAVMAFTPRVHSAQAMAEGYRKHPSRPITACSVYGESEDRDLVVGQFLEQEFQCLCSCDLFREGADFPAVANLVMARPTKSGLVYRQMLGRGLRTFPGKEYCVVVDYAWNSGRHDLFEPINLFDASGMDLDILKIAGNMIDAGKFNDPREALEEAERVHHAELVARIVVKERTPTYKMLAYDPFQVGSILGIPNRQRENQKPINARNRGRLAVYKLDPGNISNAQAERLLFELDRRRNLRLATHRQVALLVAKEVPDEIARDLTFDQASSDLDIIIGERRRA